MELHCQIQFRRLCTLVVLSAVLFGAAESQAAKNSTAKLRDSPVITVPNRRIGSIFDSVSNAFGNAMTNTRPPYLSQYSRNQTYSDGFSNRYAQPSSIFTFPQAQSTGDVCSLPEVIGTGPYRIPRWYFNPATSKCELFYYSGCCGNGNNFPTFESCQVLCEVDPCGQPRDPGVGSLQIPRFYFNTDTRMCEQFTYLGSGGNRNNFAGQAECRARCKEDPNPCLFGDAMRSPTGGLMQCGFGAIVTNNCPINYYCHIGARVSTTVCCPVGPGDRCTQPLVEGIPGQDPPQPRFYFDPISQQCRQFSYRGLQGNQNNFLSQNECDNSCFINPCGTGTPFRAGPTVQQCSANNPTICPQRYYCHIGADSRTTVCCPTQGDPCTQPRNVGNGNAQLQRWYLDPQSAVCRPFTYSGRGGNQNNFLTEEECKQTCKVFINACVRAQPALAPNGFPQVCTSLQGCPNGYWCHIGSSQETTMCCPGAQANPCLNPISVGQGQEQISRWYYDPNAKRCTQFSYLGIGGNQNNFRSRDECTQLCPEFINPCPQGEPPTQPGPGGFSVPTSCAALNIGSFASSPNCPPNYWCHIGAREDTTFCCPGSGDPCSFPMSVGSGNAQLPRFYFNPNNRQCVQFIYSGLKGNQNNFINQRDCESVCPVFRSPCAKGANPALDFSSRPVSCQPVSRGSVSSCPQGYYCHIGATSESTVCCPSLGNACDLPMTEGVGTAILPRFSFTSATRQCVTFTYRGTQGNDNNFLTQESCASVCPVFVNPCPEASQLFPSSFSSIPISCANGRSCSGGFWCHIGADDSSTVCCRGGEDRCSLPMVQGSGTAQLVRYAYNPQTRQCNSFTYRGLFGNFNSFVTQQECERVCPVFVNPCLNGDPLLGSDGRPRLCSQDGFTCTAGYYCHIGAASDTTVCCRSSGDPCRVPYSAGSGNAQLPRWYYDPNSLNCIQFSYTGMKGNDNNFLNRQDCEAACPVYINPCAFGQPLLGQNGRPTVCTTDSCAGNYWCHIGQTSATTACCPGRSDPCQAQYSLGTGSAGLPRYYFDPSSRTCRSFSYGGLKGSQNNFLSQRECEQQCPIFINPCPVALLSTQITYCSENNLNSCAYGQWCHVGANKDTTLCCPNAVDPCNVPVVRGSGNANLPRWSYDPTARQCSQFYYGGLGGNQNNFLNRQACETACPVWINPCPDGQPLLTLNRPQQCSRDRLCPSSHWCHLGATSDTTVCCPNPGDPCQQQLAQGQGTATLPRWYFDPVQLRCSAFTYLGIRGNQNNFLSQQDCSTTCGEFVNPCSRGEPARGPDRRPLQCSRFGSSCPNSYWCHIGGTQDTTVCCPGAGDACQMPMMVGTGNLNLPRWYYDSNSLQCVSFNYRGLMGNQNNFLTKNECEASGCQLFVNPCRNGNPATDPSGLPQRCNSFSGNCGGNFWCHLGAGPDTTVCCPGRMDEACQMPVLQGSGSATLPRWGFNAVTRQCESFTYRGLLGNQNNFVSREQCGQLCPEFINPCPSPDPAMTGSAQPRYCSQLNPICPNNYWCHFGAKSDETICCYGAQNACELPQTRGSGPSSLNRWSYSPQLRQCSQFQYSGRGGNQNNFLSQADCERTCIVYQNPCPTGEPLLQGNRPQQCSFQSGCGSGYWCHLGGDADTTVCCPGSLQSACDGIPSLVGSGNFTLPRWYFDMNNRQCVAFVYTGLKGNQNNFQSNDDCASTCPVWNNPCVQPVQTPTYCSVGNSFCRTASWCHIGGRRDTTVCCPGAVDETQICFLPLLSGLGNEQLPRYYFNSQSRTCSAFNYLGTKGNQNNFLTIDECRQKCNENPCALGQPLMNPSNQPQTCSAFSTSSSCPSSYWCHVGQGPDTTLCCPGAVARPCDQPQATGSGAANLPRWYYNANQKRCTQFTYSGLRGNQNNFLSQESCQATCREFENPCSGQPATTPNGQVVFCSFTNKDSCPINFWCHLGATAETTLCCPGPTNSCSVPLAPGTGNFNLPRWYYNSDTRTCVSFTYNGLGGNQNNFLTRSECENVCPVFVNPCLTGPPATGYGGRPLQCNPGFSNCPAGYWCHMGATADETVCCPGAVDNVCQLPRLVGAGPSNLQRFCFDNTNRKCTQFVYTGRFGNQNNFPNKDECLRTCPEFDNPCRDGEPEKNEFGSPRTCVPFLPTSACSPGYFCHIGADPLSSAPTANYCCPAFGSDPCSTSRVDGEGRANLQRFFFNPSTGDCDTFYYRGRKGTQNNFLTKDECLRQCVPDKNPCMPPDQPLKDRSRNSVCRREINSCPPTHYCHIGADQYSTTCCPKRGNPCDQSLVVGSYTDRLNRWYFNKDEDGCMPFTYSGLGGNENNFLSKDECETTCPGYRGYCPHAKPLLLAGTPATCGVETRCPSSNYVCHINTEKATSTCCPDPGWFCLLPRDPGNCQSFGTRYGYNRETGNCVPFQFSGCGGNLNNFLTLEKCTSICCDKGLQRRFAKYLLKA